MKVLTMALNTFVKMFSKFWLQFPAKSTGNI